MKLLPIKPALRVSINLHQESSKWVYSYNYTYDFKPADTTTSTTTTTNFSHVWRNCIVWGSFDYWGGTVSEPSLCNLLQCYSPYPPLQLPASNLTNVMMQTLFTKGCEPARQRKKKKKKQHCCHSWLFLVRIYVLCTEKKEFMGYPFFTPFRLSFITEMVEIWHLNCEELQWT